MVKIYYKDILVGKVLTNMNLTVDEALYLVGFEMNEFIKENGFEDIDYNDFKLVYE